MKKYLIPLLSLVLFLATVVFITIFFLDDDDNTSTQNSSGGIIESIDRNDEVLASIPLEEILAGGPGKDGIPSIDNPQFISSEEAGEFLDESSLGIGIDYEGEQRFYPFQILVWHEIVNDTIANDPILITYCPLCATAIAFDRTVDGQEIEFGVSGQLWLSNLLMYDRTENVEDESLWSQILGEAVVGPQTGTRLEVIDSNNITYGEWIEAFPNSVVLSQNTGFERSYDVDPYGDYYTNDTVGFGASFDDDRLDPKALVAGIEINGEYKAYEINALEDETIDAFQNNTIQIIRDTTGRLTFTADGKNLKHINSFWFSWLAVHPETDLFL